MSAVVWTLVSIVTLGISAAVGAWAVGSFLDRVERHNPDHGLLRGGMWIGVLERLAITGGILAGHPEAAAIVIAVKGLGRYPELRGGKDAEKFIVGTLASYLWAAVIGVVGLAIGHAIS
jgi:hypothetical protein